jgi:hypothetical protein
MAYFANAALFAANLGNLLVSIFNWPDELTSHEKHYDAYYYFSAELPLQ